MSIGFMSLDEAKDRLGKSEEELRDLAEKGNINLIEDEGEIYVSAADVEDMAGDTRPKRGAALEGIDPSVHVPEEREHTEEDDIPIELEPDEESQQESGMSKIKAFGGTGIQANRGMLDTSNLQRGMNKTGGGATRCRTFHAKLNDSSMAYMNNQINEWIDSDPEIEIKYATSSVGVVEGKHAEPHLILTVFY